MSTPIVPTPRRRREPKLCRECGNAPSIDRATPMCEACFERRRQLAAVVQRCAARLEGGVCSIATPRGWSREWGERQHDDRRLNQLSGRLYCTTEIARPLDRLVDELRAVVREAYEVVDQLAGEIAARFPAPAFTVDQARADAARAIRAAFPDRADAIICAVLERGVARGGE